MWFCLTDLSASFTPARHGAISKMPVRSSIVPELDMNSIEVEKEANKSSPRSPNVQASDDDRGPLTPNSPKSSPPPFDKETTIRPVTQDSSNNSESSTLSSPPTTNFNPSLTAIPQYPPSPTGSPTGSPKHNRDPSKSFFANLKAPKTSHKTQKSDSSSNLAENPKSRGSSRDRKTHLSSKPYGSSPDLLGLVRNAEQQERSECLFPCDICSCRC